ncbi:MAG: polysaccharide deacetylase family protein [Capsulimonadaceae bacterium]
MSNRIRVVLAAAILLLAGGVYYIQRYHTVPIERELNPVDWVKHWRGEDRYDASRALLEHGDPNVHAVAITIDDGPDPRYGPAIAAYLHSQDVPATFFMVGIRVNQYPEVVRTIAKDGFEIGNHTYDHQRLPALKPHEIANELILCSKHIKAVTGRATTLMRPPGVQYDDKVLRVARSLGYVTISWTCGAQDYDNQPASFIAQRVLDRTENGSIILLHQDHESTVGALPIIVAGLKARGYKFVTISQMLHQLNARLPSPTPAMPIEPPKTGD